MEPPAKKLKKPDGHDIKSKGNKDQFDFNTEISFVIQECQDQISRGNIEVLSANLTSIAMKLKKRNRSITSGMPIDHQWDGLLCRNMNKTPWQVILTMHKKLDKQNKGQSEKGKQKHPPVLHSHPHPRSLKHPVSSFGMPVSKMDILRQSLQKQNLNTIQTTPSTIPSTTPLTIPSDSPERPKAQTPT